MPLDVVYIASRLPPGGRVLMIPDGSPQTFGAAVTDKAACTASEHVPGLEVNKHLFPDNRVRALVRLSRQAGLLVWSLAA